MPDAALVVEETSGAALLGFEAHGLQPDCIGAATLHVHATDVDIPVYAWVSLETALPHVGDGASFGSYIVEPGSPEAPSEVDGSTLRWDLTELLRWSRSTQSASEFFVVALRPAFDAVN